MEPSELRLVVKEPALNALRVCVLQAPLPVCQFHTQFVNFAMQQVNDFVQRVAGTAFMRSVDELHERFHAVEGGDEIGDVLGRRLRLVKASHVNQTIRSGRQGRLVSQRRTGRSTCTSQVSSPQRSPGLSPQGASPASGSIAHALFLQPVARALH